MAGNSDCFFLYRKNTFLFRVISTTHKSVAARTFDY